MNPKGFNKSGSNANITKHKPICNVNKKLLIIQKLFTLPRRHLIVQSVKQKMYVHSILPQRFSPHNYSEKSFPCKW